MHGGVVGRLQRLTDIDDFAIDLTTRLFDLRLEALHLRVIRLEGRQFLLVLAGQTHLLAAQALNQRAAQHLRQ